MKTAVRATPAPAASKESPHLRGRSWSSIAAQLSSSLEHAQKLLAASDPRAVEANSGRTALHKAAFWGHEHVARKLLGTWGMAVDAQDYAGDTALHDASRFGHAQIVGLLLEAGADATRANKDGLTPLALAREHGKDDVVKLLSQSLEHDAQMAAQSRRRAFVGTSDGSRF